MAKPMFEIRPPEWWKHLKWQKKFFWGKVRRKWKRKNERFSPRNTEYDT